MKSKSNKFLLAYFLVAMCTTVYSQRTIMGKITDSNTESPVAHANIFMWSDQNRGVVSNALGEFILQVREDMSPSDSLVVSVLGYQTWYMRLDAVPDGVDISLQANALLLEGVTVTFKEKVHKILRKAVNRIPKNYGTKRFVARGYYQEYSIIDTSYSELVESFVNIQDRRYTHPEDESIIKVDQMRRSGSGAEMPEEIEKFFAFNRIYTIYERMNNVRQHQFYSLDQKPHDKSSYKIDHYREYDEKGDTLIEIEYSSHIAHKAAIGYSQTNGRIILRKSDLAFLLISRGNKRDHTFHEVTYRKLGDKYFPNRISYKYAVEDEHCLLYTF